ncbi:GLUTATHIONE HYDROLASE 1-RELATED [Salix koriyanagi]|uniref:GLUTATHIONE HYDROLASE 1-RELATED n=1 Tax=Salix koriyanagi TaxID=2511006 RepID=A0A9Q1AMN9_9ROSI|nr:GLUTATHIONE HYDROLASE 1-RELATED [Salix koriyanagi]
MEDKILIGFAFDGVWKMKIDRIWQIWVKVTVFTGFTFVIQEAHQTPLPPHPFLSHKDVNLRARNLPVLLFFSYHGQLLHFSSVRHCCLLLGLGNLGGPARRRHEVVASHGVVATDDERCSRIGLDALREGGHAVDAAVAASLCLGVVGLASSGMGGGSFMMILLANGEAQAFDMRETAPMKALRGAPNFLR